MNTLKANISKPWLSNEYDVPVLENEEMWASRVIDESNMKVELIKEEKPFNQPWFEIVVDGRYITGSHNETEIQEKYKKLLQEKTTETIRTVLKCEEIDVNLQS